MLILNCIVVSLMRRSGEVCVYVYVCVGGQFLTKLHQCQSNHVERERKAGEGTGLNSDSSVSVVERERKGGGGTGLNSDSSVSVVSCRSMCTVKASFPPITCSAVHGGWRHYPHLSIIHEAVHTRTHLNTRARAHTYTQTYARNEHRTSTTCMTPAHSSRVERVPS